MGVRGPVTDEQLEDLHRIKRSQQHLLGIINDILNFSRMEAGQMTYEYATVPLSSVIESVGHMIEPQAAAKKVKLAVEACEPGCFAWADKSKVEQIVLNLLSNAVKFTDEGTVTIACGQSDGQHVEITISDTGVGIPSDQHERIFEPFVQIGRARTHGHQGTGLGLAISRDLARAMGGDISVSSEIGKGSLFRLTLPRAPSA
jgi:signal transduction histidine kinase